MKAAPAKQYGWLGNAKKVLVLLIAVCAAASPLVQCLGEDRGLTVKVNKNDGSYSLAFPVDSAEVLRAGVAVQVDGRWLHASDYPRHDVIQSETTGYLGQASVWKVTYSGLAGQPELVYHLRAYVSKPFGDIQVTVRNTTSKVIHIEAIRSLDATEGPIVDLGGPPAADRVLSDSWSEDRPNITIHDLADRRILVHRGVGSQLHIEL